MIQRGAALAAALLVAPHVEAATCTVKEVQVLVRSVGQEGNVPSVVGFAIPVTVDEAKGTIAFDFTTFPQNADFQIVIDNALNITQQVDTGTIDASGAVHLPSLPLSFLTDANQRSVPLAANPALSTGIGTTRVGTQEYVDEGSPVDFASGDLTLEGEIVVPNAPLANGPISEGLRLVCTLGPLPSKTKLPKGATLATATAKAKLAADADTLTKLVAKVTNGTAPADPAKGVFVRLRDGSGTDVLLVHVDAVDLGGKKMKKVTDTDGLTIFVLAGQKRTGGAGAPVSGTLTLKQAKKGFTIVFSEKGLDFSKLAAGGATATVQIGDVAASKPVQVKKTSKSLSFR